MVLAPAGETPKPSWLLTKWPLLLSQQCAGTQNDMWEESLAQAVLKIVTKISWEEKETQAEVTPGSMPTIRMSPAHRWTSPWDGSAFVHEHKRNQRGLHRVCCKQECPWKLQDESTCEGQVHTAQARQVEDSIQSHSLNCSFSTKKLLIWVCLHKTTSYEIEIPLGVSGLPTLRRKKVEELMVSKLHEAHEDTARSVALVQLKLEQFQMPRAQTSFSTEGEMWKS